MTRPPPLLEPHEIPSPERVNGLFRPFVPLLNQVSSEQVDPTQGGVAMAKMGAQRHRLLATWSVRHVSYEFAAAGGEFPIGILLCPTAYGSEFSVLHAVIRSRGNTFRGNGAWIWANLRFYQGAALVAGPINLVQDNIGHKPIEVALGLTIHSGVVAERVWATLDASDPAAFGTAIGPAIDLDVHVYGAAFVAPLTAIGP